MGGYYTRRDQDEREFWGCVGTVVLFAIVVGAIAGLCALFGWWPVLLWGGGAYLAIGVFALVSLLVSEGWGEPWWLNPIVVVAWPAFIGILRGE